MTPKLSVLTAEVKDLRIENKELGQALREANADIERKDGLIGELAAELSEIRNHPLADYISKSKNNLLARAQSEIGKDEQTME